jgi:HK97 family phage major capsid protein
MTMVFPALVAAEATLKSKKDELGKIFAEAGPDLDLEKVKSLEGSVEEKAESIKKINSEVEKAEQEVKRLQGVAAAAARAAEFRTDTDDSGDGVKGAGDGGKADGPVSLGEHFIKGVGEDGLSRLKTSGASVAVKEWRPEVKAASDPNLIPAAMAPWLTTYDRTVVRAFRRPVVSDLLGTGTLGAGSNAVSYFVEGAIEGAFATVAENGLKPSLHAADPTTRTDALKKIAGILTFSDEMVEDAAFWVSEINERGLYLLALAEENQLLNGAGTGSTVLGLLNRGIQTETAANNTDNADALFRAMTKVQTATGLMADGVVINPTDYQRLRLAKDANNQYMGGGFFQGQYGNGSMDWQPPLWGLRTVVSPAVAAGTALVGAFQAASTVYRKGGVRVESTNSHDEDFAYNRVRTRIEERVALAVRIPSAFVAVSQTATPPA